MCYCRFSVFSLVKVDFKTRVGWVDLAGFGWSFPHGFDADCISDTKTWTLTLVVGDSAYI